MVSWIDQVMEFPQAERASFWQGASGTTYKLDVLNLRTFILNGADIYLIVRDKAVLWAGCGPDLVTEPANRLRFRNALTRADSVFRLPRPVADEARLSTIADLEGAVLLAKSQAA